MRTSVAAACLGLFVLAGCEAVNEGVTDYRKADIISGTAMPQDEKTNLNKKYDITTGPRGDVPINAFDTFYVSLLQAYVGRDARFGGFPHLEDRQEMLVILRVRDSNAPDSPGEFAFYSDDVVRGQFLNFSNMLTLGPTFYQGGVITIDVDEIRLEDTTQGILKQLNDLERAKMDVVGPDPTKRKNWNAVARDLFDIIDRNAYGTRYTLTLMPSGGVSELPYPRFEAGNYVLMRHAAHDGEIDWGAMQLDNNTGRLVSGRDISQYSYVTVQINALRGIPQNFAPEARKRPLRPLDRPVDAPKYQSLDQAKACPPGSAPTCQDYPQAKQ